MHLKMASIQELFSTGYVFKQIYTAEKPEKSIVLELERTDIDAPNLMNTQESAQFITLDLKSYLNDRINGSVSIPRSEDLPGIGRDYLIKAMLPSKGIFNIARIMSRERAQRLAIAFSVESAKAYPEVPSMWPGEDPISSEESQMNTIIEYSQLFAFTNRALKDGRYTDATDHIRRFRRDKRLTLQVF